MTAVKDGIKSASRAQNTIKEAVSYSGIGIHTGRTVTLRFVPAECGTGVVFKRVDLPGAPEVPASLEYVCDSSRSTTLGVSDVRIHTVEHVLAAVRAFNIDNLVIEISSIEPPIGRGSSDVFVDLIKNAGVSEQSATLPIVYLNQPIYWSEGGVHVIGLPDDKYRISYTLHYPDSEVLKCQYQSFEINQKNFCQELAPCRTFSEYKEVEMLMERGLIKGGSLDNAVIINGDAVISKEGLFFSDEMVRHKILDMVGDLALVGLDFRANIVAVRSGHFSNVSFAKILFQTLTRETI